MGRKSHFRCFLFQSTRRTYRSADHLSNFQLAPSNFDYQANSSEKQWTRKSPKLKPKKPVRQFDKEEFVKSSFQFHLLENAALPTNANSPINWEHIVAVSFNTFEPYQCPICLNNPVAPRVIFLFNFLFFFCFFL